MSSVDEVQEYLRFFASKRTVADSEIEAVFRDNNESRLVDDMFSKDEVETMLAALLMDVKETFQRELERTAKIGALVVEQMIVGGAAAGAELHVNMARAEDEGSLARVGTGDAARLAEAELKKSSGVRLDSIRDEHATLVADVQRLKDENVTLKERYQTVQSRATSAVKDVSQLTQEVARLEKELSTAKTNASSMVVTESAKVREQAAKMEDLELTVAKLQERLADAEAARKASEEAAAASPTKDVPVTSSKQFVQLKGMLDKKNRQLAELRKQLAKYEPDEADLVDDREVPTGK